MHNSHSNPCSLWKNTSPKAGSNPSCFTWSECAPWTEALTLISQTHAPDDVYNELKRHFSEKEIVDLTFAIGTINLWNRLAISLRSVPGHYKPAKAAASS